MAPALPPRLGSGLRLPAVAVALMLVFAGCGGETVEYEEVPGGPADITLPRGSGDADADPADADADADADESADDTETEDQAAGESEPEATPTPTPEPQTGATTGDSTQGTGDASAGTSTPAAEDGPDSDAPPAPGSDSERFEEFCAQNEGAC